MVLIPLSEMKLFEMNIYAKYLFTACLCSELFAVTRENRH